MTLPESLEEIEMKAFKDCTSLKEITLPDGIRIVEPGAFADCTDIKIIYKGMVFTPDKISALLGSVD